jgi:hypothetical protein
MAKKGKKESRKIEVTLEDDVLEEVDSIMADLKRRAGKDVSYEDCVKFLVSHYINDTYVVYVPDEFKKKKDEWEKKTGERKSNNEFLAFLIENLKV